MSDDRVGRFLRTEELYRQVVRVADHDASVCSVELDETKLRGLLDAIFSAGKIEGRLTALHKDMTADDDRLIDDWQRIVDSAS